MKYSLFLIVVALATASNALPEDVKEKATTSNATTEAVKQEATTSNASTEDVKKAATTAATTEVLGKPVAACRNRNSWSYTHHVPHETNPHLFYKCLGPYGFLQSCPTLQGVPLIFNKVSMVCDWEGAFTDDSSNTPQSSTPTPPWSTSRPPPPPPNCSVNPDRKKPHPDCHKFYVCENGVPTERTCPPGLNFDVTIAECAFVNCH